MSDSRRITDLLLNYWNTLRGNRFYPSVEEINKEALTDIWDFCFIIDVFNIREGGSYNYTYLGEGIKNAYGSDLTPDKTLPLASIYAEALEDKYMEVMRTNRPVIEQAHFINSQGQTVKYRQCLLPLGKGDVEAILGGMRYAIFNENDEKIAP